MYNKLNSVVNEAYYDADYYYFRINEIDDCKDWYAYLTDSSFTTISDTFNLFEKHNKLVFKIPFDATAVFFTITGSQHDLGDVIDPKLAKFFYFLPTSGGSGQPTRLVSDDSRTIVTGSGSYNLHIDTTNIIVPDFDKLISMDLFHDALGIALKGDTRTKYKVLIDGVEITGSYNTDDATKYQMDLNPPRDEYEILITNPDESIIYKEATYIYEGSQKIENELYYISTSGDDNNPGTEELPFETILGALTALKNIPAGAARVRTHLMLNDDAEFDLDIDWPDMDFWPAGQRGIVIDPGWDSVNDRDYNASLNLTKFFNPAHGIFEIYVPITINNASFTADDLPLIGVRGTGQLTIGSSITVGDLTPDFTNEVDWQGNSMPLIHCWNHSSIAISNPEDTVVIDCNNKFKTLIRVGMTSELKLFNVELNNAEIAINNDDGFLTVVDEIKGNAGEYVAYGMPSRILITNWSNMAGYYNVGRMGLAVWKKEFDPNAADDNNPWTPFETLAGAFNYAARHYNTMLQDTTTHIGVYGHPTNISEEVHYHFPDEDDFDAGNLPNWNPGYQNSFVIEGFNSMCYPDDPDCDDTGVNVFVDLDKPMLISHGRFESYDINWLFKGDLNEPAWSSDDEGEYPAIITIANKGIFNTEECSYLIDSSAIIPTDVETSYFNITTGSLASIIYEETQPAYGHDWIVNGDNQLTYAARIDRASELKTSNINIKDCEGTIHNETGMFFNSEAFIMDGVSNEYPTNRKNCVGYYSVNNINMIITQYRKVTSTQEYLYVRLLNSISVFTDLHVIDRDTGDAITGVWSNEATNLYKFTPDNLLPEGWQIYMDII
jgi:hypothetical protein